MRIFTVTCPKCGRVIRPLVSNLPSSDAQCPECGGWFWVSLTAWHAYAAQQNVGTEECECEYGGKCWLVNMMDRTITPYTYGMVRNFDCDFVLPRYDAAVADALADLKEHGLSAERLDNLYTLIRNINGECIFWK